MVFAEALAQRAQGGRPGPVAQHLGELPQATAPTATGREG
jgi:hypothetical protein